MVIATFLGWIVVGLIVGFVASKVVDLHGDDVRFGLAASVVGAVVAGIAFAVISASGLTPWRPLGLVFAAIGAAVGATTWHLIRSRTISHDQGTVRRSY
jgi:uncharacterized membrane protein YeaQ/YmgE (transglycosylase-associated protein family)